MSDSTPRFLVAAFLKLGLIAPEAGVVGALHAEIDRLIAAGAGGPVVGPASDAEFARRAWVDLAGRKTGSLRSVEWSFWSSSSARMLSTRMRTMLSDECSASTRGSASAASNCSVQRR